MMGLFGSLLRFSDFKLLELSGEGLVGKVFGTLYKYMQPYGILTEMRIYLAGITSRLMI